MSGEDNAFRRSTPPAAPGLALLSLQQQNGEGKADADDPTTPVRKPSLLADENQQTQVQLRAIHEELDKLRQRREELERRRRQLLAASIPPRPGPSRSPGSHANSADGYRGSSPGRSALVTPTPISLSHSNFTHPTSSSQLRAGSAPRPRGTQSLSRTHGSFQGDRPGCASVSSLFAAPIPSENERRQRLKETPHWVVKNGMHEAAKQDSALVMGSFLLEDQSRVCTFGRERRFMPVVGQRGSYYLATDTALAQEEARVASARKGPSSHPDLTGTPGPGAYTPRYSKLSKPSPLVYWRQ